LSTQQQFILCWLSVEKARYRRDLRQLSWAVAHQFDSEGERFRTWTKYRGKVTNHTLSGQHSASFGRTLRRLEERELIDRRGSSRKQFYHDSEDGLSSRWVTGTRGIELTADGESVGTEILRRERDGRYGLSFDLIPEDDELPDLVQER